MGKSPKSSAKQANDGCIVWAVIGGILLLLYLISRCSPDTADTNGIEAMNAANAEMGNAIAAQSPPPPEPLNAASVSRGVAQLRLAAGAEGFSGAMIYSQNCYDALSREFTWARLDQCGAADMLAARSIDSADTVALVSEPTYFQSESAAARYLVAATGAGQPAPEADTRLSQLQGRVARERLAARRPPRPANDGADSDLGNMVGNALEQAPHELEYGE